MSEIAWIGGLGSAVAQVDTFTPATIEVTDIFTLTATGEDGTTAAVSFTATGTTAANVSAGLIAAWNASTHRLHTGITASGSSTVILTADNAGVPFSVAATTTDGGGSNTQTLTRAATTANVGGSDASLAGNYFNNALPGTSGDNLTIDGRSTAAMSYGLDLSAKTATLFRVTQANRFAVGLPPSTSSTNATGAIQAAHLKLSGTTIKIGEAPGDGSSPAGANFIAVNSGTNQTLTYVYNSNNTGVNGLPVVNLKGVHASNVLNVLGGSVGVGTLQPGEVSTYATINQDGGRLLIGSGVTLTTLTQTKGSCELQCAATTVTQDGGSLKTTGSGAVTTMKVGGTADLQSTGTITTLEVVGTGNCSCANQDTARTITTIKMHKGAKLNIACSNLTISNAIQLINCRLDEVTITTNKHVTVVFAAGS